MTRFAVLTATVWGLTASCCAPYQAPVDAEKMESKPPDDDLPPMLPPIKKEDLVVGTGPEAKEGDHVRVSYRGSLLDGTEFDNSYDRGTPLALTIGDGSVIPGWELGLIGMRKGGKRKLTIPPHLGYGSQGSPPKIPPDATLVFVVELVGID